MSARSGLGGNATQRRSRGYAKPEHLASNLALTRSPPLA
jgi:hypothetical protein